MLDKEDAASPAGLAKCLRPALARHGLDANGPIPDDPGIPIALDVRRGLGPVLFHVRLSCDGSMIRAGIARPGERVERSWPHLAGGGHADGRCFQFFPGDRARASSLFQAAMAEAALHRQPTREEAETLASRLADLLPGADAAALLAVATALATGLSDGHRSALDRRLDAIDAPVRDPAP
jgi:hypothetical protein